MICFKNDLQQNTDCFSSVWVAEGPPFGKEFSPRLTLFSLIVCACPYSSNIRLYVLTLYYLLEYKY